MHSLATIPSEGLCGVRVYIRMHVTLHTCYCHHLLFHLSQHPFVMLATTLQCTICADILCQPIELSCGSLVCSQCCCKWLQFSQKLDCPCCYSHQLSTETIKTPNSVILGLFEKRQVPQQSQITVQAILDTPRTTPTNHVEKQVATSLVKRLLSESEGGVISIPTKGKVTYTVKWKSHMQNSICSQSL